MLEVEKHGTILDGVAANAAESLRTAVVAVPHDSDITFTIALTWGAATALNAALYKSVDGGVTYARVHSVSISSGTGTMSEYTVTETVTGNDDMAVDLACKACTHVKIIVSAAGGGAADLLTVKAGSAQWS